MRNLQIQNRRTVGIVDLRVKISSRFEKPGGERDLPIQLDVRCRRPQIVQLREQSGSAMKAGM